MIVLLNLKSCELVTSHSKHLLKYLDYSLPSLSDLSILLMLLVFIFSIHVGSHYALVKTRFDYHEMTTPNVYPITASFKKEKKNCTLLFYKKNPQNKFHSI